MLSHGNAPMSNSRLVMLKDANEMMLEVQWAEFAARQVGAISVFRFHMGGSRAAIEEVEDKCASIR